MNEEKLIELAIAARKNSYPIISNFAVGTALLTKSGKVYQGCNIEDKSGVGVTNCCGERVAILKAVSEGEFEFTKIAIVGGIINEDLIHCPPCGICRQYMNSFSPNLEIICHSKDKTIKYNLQELLPDSFNEEF